MKKFAYFLTFPWLLFMCLMGSQLMLKAQPGVFYNNNLDQSLFSNWGGVLYVNGSFINTGNGSLKSLTNGKLYLADSLIQNGARPVFEAGAEGNVYLFGNRPTRIMGNGSGSVGVQRIFVQKTNATDSVYIAKDLRVRDSLMMVQGNIRLSGSNIILDSATLPGSAVNYRGRIYNETQNRGISGTSGQVIKKLMVASGGLTTANNAGNTGAEIQSSLISTPVTIKRGHAAFNTTLGTSIKRYYEFVYSGTAPNGVLKFRYFQNELGSIGESTLLFIRSDDSGNSWNNLYVDSINTAQDFALTDSVNNMTLYTLVGCSNPPVIPPNQGGVYCGPAPIVLNGGSALSKYRWSTGDTTRTITYAPTGTLSRYDTITVRIDSAACTNYDTIIFRYYPPVVANLPDSVRACQGNPAIMNATQSDPNAVYQWARAGAGTFVTGSGNYSATIADTYYVRIRYDASCPYVRDTCRVILNPLPAVNLNADTSLCSATSYVLNPGVTGSSYLWSNGLTTPQITVSTSGNYAVTVTGANTCSARDSGYVRFMRLNLSHTSTPVTCYNGSNGTINISYTSFYPGGVYSFLWNDSVTTQNRTGLSAGTYWVRVRENGYPSCMYYDTIILTNPAQTINSSVVTPVSCNGLGNGSIDLTTNATAPVTYAWSNSQSSQDITNLVPATYTVTVTNGVGCTSTHSATVTQPAALSVNRTIQNVTCFNGSNGAINITPVGGTAPYRYNWSNFTTSEDLNGVIAGTYNVTVTDTNGCTTTRSYNITQPADLVANISTVQAGCNQSNGSANVFSVTGGGAPYSYLWLATGNTNPLQTGLAAGTYAVVVTNTPGCTDTAFAVITNPNAPIVAIDSILSVRCNGGADGGVQVTVSGGTAPLSYLWSNSAITPDVSGLSGGLYFLTVTDAQGCVNIASATVNEPSVLTVNGTSTDMSCAGVNDGTITLSVNGGVTPYTYSWSNSATSASLTGLSGGTYDVTVSDANLCTATASFTVGTAIPVQITLTATDALCNGGFSGSIDLTVNSGGPVTYNWNNGQISEDLNGLAAGTYSVTVTNATTCTATASAVVGEPVSLSIQPTIGVVACKGESTGSISVTVSGGTQAYGYLWNAGGGATNTRIGIPAGDYTLTVTDANSCTLSQTFTVGEPDSLLIGLVTNNEGCTGDNNGSVISTVTGGNAPYTYNWNIGAASAAIVGLDQGAYGITVTDTKGCVASASAAVDSIPPVEAYFLAGSMVGAEDSIQFIDVSFPVPQSYLWSFGDSLGTQSTLADPVFAYPVSFTADTSYYQVSLVVYLNGCYDTMTKTIVIDNTSAKGGPGTLPGTSVQGAGISISAYPNPTMDQLNLRVNLIQEEPVEILVFDIFGKKMSAMKLNGLKEYKTSLSLGQYAAGTYVVRAQTPSVSESIRVVLIR